MHCRNCGALQDDKAAVCISCGVGAGAGDKFCWNCGAASGPSAAICIKCGVAFPQRPQALGAQPPKSKLVAGLLGVFLGGFGIHRFYLGYNTIGVIQLLVTIVGGLVTCGLGWVAGFVWGLVEGILILTGSINKDSQGQNLAV